MAMTVIKKYDLGGGWYQVWVGTNNADSLNNKERIRVLEIRVNKAAFNALGANGQSDISSLLALVSLDAAPFS